MRDPTLSATLAAFAEEAALQLAMETAAGAEVPFELVEERRGRSPALYCYRPLTGEFIRDRGPLLGRLPGHPAALRALERLDLGGYLARRGAGTAVPEDARERAEAALGAFLADVFADSGEFELSPARLRRAYDELESAAYGDRPTACVVAPVLGLELESAEVDLGGGLTLARGETRADVPPEAVYGLGGTGERAHVLAVLSLRDEPSLSAPVRAARTRLRRLLSALRLFEAGGFALGPAGWLRAGDGEWRIIPLGAAGRPRGLTRIAAAHEDELRAFCNLAARRAAGRGEILWALARFEMGLERLAPFEALTDHLLALRALLEPEGPDLGRLPRRLAALCATPEDRPALAARVAEAVALERTVVCGMSPGQPGGGALVEELAGHLRALLRDVICGHLEPDLCALADDLLARSAGAGARPA